MQLWEPFKDRNMMWIETMNEVTEIFLLYNLQMYTEWIGDPEVRHQIGWCFIAVVATYMLVHLSMLIRGSIARMRLSLKKCRHNKRLKLAEKRKKQRQRDPEMVVDIIFNKYVLPNRRRQAAEERNR